MASPRVTLAKATEGERGVGDNVGKGVSDGEGEGVDVGRDEGVEEGVVVSVGFRLVTVEVAFLSIGVPETEGVGVSVGARAASRRLQDRQQMMRAIRRGMR
jgi:hypothetical protein